MGIHELRGYGRIFSAIGLKPELAEYFGTRNFLGSENAGYGFLELERTLLEREGFLRAEKVLPAKDFRFNPRIYKAAQEVATGQAPYAHFQEKVRASSGKTPWPPGNFWRYASPKGARWPRRRWTFPWGPTPCPSSSAP